MFKLTVSDIVTFPVKGVITDAEGRALPFDFHVSAKRAPAEELDLVLADHERKSSDYMGEKMTGWKGVVDEHGVAVEFSAAAVRQLFSVAGLSNLVYLAYLGAVGAKAKEKN